jgi:hypothetical protein
MPPWLVRTQHALPPGPLVSLSPVDPLIPAWRAGQLTADPPIEVVINPLYPSHLSVSINWRNQSLLLLFVSCLLSHIFSLSPSSEACFPSQKF